MNKLVGAALLGAAFVLSACGEAAENAAQAEATEAALDPGTGAADMSPTLEGSGDMSSAAGAGADTAAMDGGSAGDDGAPAAGGEGEGGPSDALGGEEGSAR